MSMEAQGSPPAPPPDAAAAARTAEAAQYRAIDALFEAMQAHGLAVIAMTCSVVAGALAIASLVVSLT